MINALLLDKKINACSPNGEPSGQHEEKQAKDEANIVRKTELKESQTNGYAALKIPSTCGSDKVFIL